MLVPCLLFALGLVLLIKGGDWFVDGAVDLAGRFRLPELLIGATVVSIGTTLPEVMVSSQAAFSGVSGISYGNAIGSVICNTSLIAALTVAIRPTEVEKNSLRFPVLAFFIAAACYAAIAYTSGTFQRWHGICLLGFFVVYMVTTILRMKQGAGEAPMESSTEEASQEFMPIWKELLLLIVGAAAIAFGANLLVDNGTLIASALGVPELITAITSLIKGHSSLSLGNIIGANLFNIVLVSGAAITISPFSIPAEKTLMGINSSLLVDLPVMFLVMILLCIPTLLRGKLQRWQGIMLLCIYVAFTAFQFIS